MLWHSSLWHYIASWETANLSQEHTASNCTLKMKVVHPYETLIITCKITRCHNTEEQIRVFTAKKTAKLTGHSETRTHDTTVATVITICCNVPALPTVDCSVRDSGMHETSPRLAKSIAFKALCESLYSTQVIEWICLLPFSSVISLTLESDLTHSLITPYVWTENKHERSLKCVKPCLSPFQKDTCRLSIWEAQEVTGRPKLRNAEINDLCSSLNYDVTILQRV